MKRILIVDDDTELCDELEDLLAGEGYAVDTAHDGVRGMELAGAARYGAVLLDYKIPGPGIADILGAMRKKQPDAKILIISGRPFLNAILKNEQFASLTDGVMAKPFDAESLLKAVRSPR
jgi:two-component system response regulator CpxR